VLFSFSQSIFSQKGGWDIKVNGGEKSIKHFETKQPAIAGLFHSAPVKFPNYESAGVYAAGSSFFGFPWHTSVYLQPRGFHLSASDMIMR
jgi:hypothetical protein